MSTRRLSNIENQPEILQFVGKEIISKVEKLNKEGKEEVSSVRAATSASAVRAATSASASTSVERTSPKKRARKELSSPEESAEKQPAKKTAMSTSPASDNNTDQPEELKL